MARRHRMEPGNWRSVVARLEELVVAASGADAFEVVLALVMARLEGERAGGQLPGTDAAVACAVDASLRDVHRRWPGLVQPDALAALDPATTAACVRLLADRSLAAAEFEVLDPVFEHLISASSKGSKGQFFTPRHVVECCVRIAAPQPGEHILDPACGSGGFLLHALGYVRRSQPDLHPDDWSGRYLHGVDWDERAVRVARALLLVAGGRPDGVRHGDSLSRAGSSPFATALPKRGADLILTNPPFAGEVSDPELLASYELGRGGGRIERDVLFIERCVDLLRPGGRLVIVLPHNKVGGRRFAPLRRWLLERLRVVAVVGLPQPTFMPHTSQKTAIVVGVKRAHVGLPAVDEAIHFAVSERSGKDRRGAPMARDGELGTGPAWQTLDHDLDQVVAGLGQPFGDP